MDKQAITLEKGNGQGDGHQGEPSGHVFHISIDGEIYETAAHELTAREILQLAGLDPTVLHLVQIHGKAQESYENEPDKIVHIHEKAKFLSVSNGPTPVS